MSLICFASGKGAPGVTLTALGFAAAKASTGRKVVVLEADRGGGTLAVRYQLSRQPGLITLAAAGRHGLTRDDLWNHAQALPGGLPAIVAPEREDRTSAILREGGQRLGRWLADIPDIDVVADCGRIDSESLASGIVAAADMLYLLARPSAEEIQPAAALASNARDRGISVGWVLIGDRPHAPAEIESVTSVAVEAVLPDDPRSAQAMIEGRSEGRGKRSRLTRAIAALAAGSVQTSPTADAAEHVPTSEQRAVDSEPVPLAALAGEVVR